MMPEDPKILAMKVGQLVQRDFNFLGKPAVEVIAELARRLLKYSTSFTPTDVSAALNYSFREFSEDKTLRTMLQNEYDRLCAEKQQATSATAMTETSTPANKMTGTAATATTIASETAPAETADATIRKVAKTGTATVSAAELITPVNMYATQQSGKYIPTWRLCWDFARWLKTKLPDGDVDPKLLRVLVQEFCYVIAAGGQPDFAEEFFEDRLVEIEHALDLVRTPLENLWEVAVKAAEKEPTDAGSGS